MPDLSEVGLRSWLSRRSPAFVRTIGQQEEKESWPAQAGTPLARDLEALGSRLDKVIDSEACNSSHGSPGDAAREPAHEVAHEPAHEPAHGTARELADGAVLQAASDGTGPASVARRRLQRARLSAGGSIDALRIAVAYMRSGARVRLFDWLREQQLDRVSEGLIEASDRQASRRATALGEAAADAKGPRPQSRASAPASGASCEIGLLAEASGRALGHSLVDLHRRNLLEEIFDPERVRRVLDAVRQKEEPCDPS